MSDPQIDDIPPTEPVATAEAPPKRRPGRPRKHPLPEAVQAPTKRARFAGAELVPDLERHRAAVTTAYWYWIGALPGMPAEWVTLGGECFPKMEEDLVPHPKDPTKRLRLPRIGALVRLTRAKFDHIRDHLSRTVVRMTHEPAQVAVGPGVQNTGAPVARGRKGFLITIPTAAEVEQRRKANIALNTYTQDPRDEPVARYLFARLCDNQERGERGDSYPEPLEVTGLEWPEE